MSTPKMYCALQHHSTSRSATSCMTYHGSLGFLYSQDAFDHIWPNPTPVHNFTQANGGITNITLKLWHFCCLCHLHAFNTNFRMDYIGFIEDLDATSIKAIGTKLRKFTVTYILWGETHHSSPITIYQKYLDELPMLPDDAKTWGFNLINMFWTSLTEGLKGALLNFGYAQPSYKSMNTKKAQKQALVLTCALMQPSTMSLNSIRNSLWSTPWGTYSPIKPTDWPVHSSNP